MDQESSPHEAMFLVLGYLPVYELLLMSQVCRSLRDALNNDVLPWLNILVQRPLSSRLSDHTLINITSKANGGLKTLSLINCIHITNHGLQTLVRQNPHITKLHIPGCSSITPDGVVAAVTTLCHGSNCLRTLRINGIYNLNREHLRTLASCLNNNLQLEQQPPLLYHERHRERERIIDLEACPKCYEAREVYDCPKRECECRACSFCIPRCENCGGCIASEQVEEAACSDILCLNCWLHEHPKCSFCNKPYCRQHTSWWPNSSDSTFVCRVCQENSSGYTYMDDFM
ncbi:hypothetical protein HN51_037814 [Arachis hypogaea]|uniref:F-box domain-containing protein n=1 Tax=Arachis hypogaea TaxID=3818 RepID=A0A444ZUS2_ARAHY|nr:F-box protein SKIP28 [Arachis hypogaea]QHO03431.1 F-box protein [Arachis hypogaea]RYR17802.1 hypothetical protein Ahy_B03g062478 [Arachis hypogaea]